MPQVFVRKSARNNVEPLSPTIPHITPNSQVIDALCAIKSTSYDQSFLSRLTGIQHDETPVIMAVDWQTISPWMDLMCDIRNHYCIAQFVKHFLTKFVVLTQVDSPEREQPCDVHAPIIYAPLRQCHLNQVHDLLHHVFWSGIDGRATGRT